MQFHRLLLFLLLFNPMIYSNAKAQHWTQSQKVIAPDRDSSDLFGSESAINGNIAIIGSSWEDLDENGSNFKENAGAVYLFERMPSGIWQLSQKIVSSDRATYDNFGNSLAISKNHIIAGSLYQSKNATGGQTVGNAGAAYIFEKDNHGQWYQAQKIVASDCDISDYFGFAVRIDANHAIIGAVLEDHDAMGNNYMSSAGAAYIFEKDSNGVWLETTKLVASDRTADDQFGRYVAIDSNYAVVASNKHNSGTGAAYIFEKDSSGTWNQIQKITGMEVGFADHFASTIAISGNTIVVGVPDWDLIDTTGGGAHLLYAGAAVIFERDSLGSWTEVQMLTASDMDAHDKFGSLVAIEKDRIVISAPYEDHDQQGQYYLGEAGSMYVFERNANGLWEEHLKLVTADRQTNDVLGSVAISGNNIVVGTRNSTDASGANNIFLAGSAYFFKSNKISGSVFNDINANCQKDSTELGIHGLTGVIFPGFITVQTSQSGTWFIDSLAAGTYFIIYGSTGNWNPTCPSTQVFTVVHPDSVLVVEPYGMQTTQACAEPDVTIHMPFMRPCTSNQKIFVQVCNEIPATSSLDSSFVIIELDTSIIVQSSTIPYSNLGNNRYRFDTGTLNPGYCTNFSIDAMVSCAAILGQSLCLKALLYPADSCVFDYTAKPYTPAGQVGACNTTYDLSSLSVSGSCINGNITYTVRNISPTGIGDMSCYAPVRIFVDGIMILLDSVMLAGGDSAHFNFTGDGRTWRLETLQHPLHPGTSHPYAIVEACPNTINWTQGLVNLLPLDNLDPVIDTYCGTVTASFDPNDKTGFPIGPTNAHYITPKQKLKYIVRFQNTGTDTAFTVILRDTLDVDLDIFSVQSGASSHNYDFHIYGPRVLQWTFQNIHLPDSGTNEEGSHGFVVFKVDPQANSVLGTEINNSASILFDHNAAINTNTTLHTLAEDHLLHSWSQIDSLIIVTCGDTVLNGINYSMSGNYYNLRGDTLNVLSIQLINLDTSISANNQQLYANQNNATYQWLDCWNGLSIIPGDTSQSFNPTITVGHPGSFAVEITRGNCVDTSACYDVLWEGIIESSFGSEFKVYPNPTSGILKIELGEVHKQVLVNANNLNGMFISNSEFMNTSEFEYALTGINGYYLLQISSSTGQSAIVRVLKE